MGAQALGRTGSSARPLRDLRFAVVPGGGPGGEYEQQPRTVRARDRVTLTRVEHEERSRSGCRARVTARQLDLSFDDRDPRALTHLMIAEYLPGLEAKQDRASVAGMKYGGRPDAFRRIDLEEIPRLHLVTVSG